MANSTRKATLRKKTPKPPGLEAPSRTGAAEVSLPRPPLTPRPGCRGTGWERSGTLEAPGRSAGTRHEMCPPPWHRPSPQQHLLRRARHEDEAPERSPRTGSPPEQASLSLGDHAAIPASAMGSAWASPARGGQGLAALALPRQGQDIGPLGHPDTSICLRAGFLVLKKLILSHHSSFYTFVIESRGCSGRRWCGTKPSVISP